MLNNIMLFIDNLINGKKVDKKLIQQKIISLLNKKNPSLVKCQYCGQGNWTVGENLTVLTEYSKDGFRIGGPSFPFFFIACSNCGYSMFFNAVTGGLIDQTGNFKD
ncbi:MAG: hypothetical protein A2287_07735 [Candidatus Melainabacteria bacterium RIFOXYA12_FULL_32_12]|nr:MAG: hypothetical protein A2255_00455 [Candidatus Melainabacteria bacterium RIFOXYA2_FULL_32_9]OGI25801.1 MAG: hypothetical protein A2287_07735 [Candidatus Melainabacteria bacterium RIFOXYA12_FULL_32_12]